ncbi:MAG: hypothetical protein ACPL4H_00830 [Anaerolineales bacterium]
MLILVSLGCNFLTKRLGIRTPGNAAQVLMVNPDGQVHTDKNGVSLMIPPGALTAGAAQMASQSLEGELAQDLSQAYKLETPVYRIIAQTDGTAPAKLSFPAANPGMRLLAIIDREYAAVLNLAPQNGVLSIEVDVHPNDVSGLQAKGAMWANGSIQYAVTLLQQV